MLEGLERGDRLPFYMDMVEGKGRAVFCREEIPAESYVCEYKTSRVYPATQLRKMEREYSHNQEGSYTLVAWCRTTAHSDKRRMCFDATRRLDQVMSLVRSTTALSNMLNTHSHRSDASSTTPLAGRPTAGPLSPSTCVANGGWGS